MVAAKLKIRLDDLLVERGLAESRSQAKSFILAGNVFSNENRLEKVGKIVDYDVPLVIKGKDHVWVSRGGVKIDYAISYFGFDIGERVCLDLGASTGGFTHVLIERGAKKVYAVDVGYGQLDWKIRNSAEVIVLERTNARFLTSTEIPEPISFLCCDASFISLTKILPNSMGLVDSGGVLLALVKPQFELDRKLVGKNGIIKDSSKHQLVCEKIYDWLDSFPNWSPIGIIESPIKGAKGNTEFFIAASKL